MVQTSNPKRVAKPNNFNFWKFVQKAIHWVFEFITELTKNLFLLLDKLFSFVVYLFSQIVYLASSPEAPCVIAIAAYAAVCMIAAYQWYETGSMIGRLLKLTSIQGVGVGVAGVLVGLGINIFQMAPELWKIRRDIAEVYKNKNIDPSHHAESSQSVGDRLGNWLSVDHGKMREARRVSYLVEFGVTGFYLVTSLAVSNFFSIVIAAISLTMPEMILKWAASTIAVLGTVSQEINKAPEDNFRI